MKDRVFQVRKYLKLNQEDFGNRLGIKKSSVSNMESGRYNITDSLAKLICQEFNVNETWLRTGEGEMFIEPPQSEIDKLCELVGIGEHAKKILSIYAGLTSNEKEVFDSILMKMVISVAAENGKTPQEAEVMMGKTMVELTDDKLGGNKRNENAQAN